ncbi:MAG: hypothetical protein ACK5KP_05420 [Paludibacteraceae bacterium]
MTFNDVLQVLMWIFGAGGLISFIAYFRQNRHLKDKEVELAAANVKIANAQADSAVADNYEKILTRMESTIEMQDKRLAQSDEFHEKRYQELSKQLDMNTEKIKELNKKIIEDKQFICYDLSCQLRKKQK